MKAIGITATDTDVGKTIVSGALAAAIYKRGYKTGVFKPAASGCIKNEKDDLISTDALFLMQGARIDFSRQLEVVPYVLEAALAPAEASKLAGIEIEENVMIQAAKKMIQNNELTIVEGVGGITAPLKPDYLVKDFFKDLKLPIIIIVRSVLGSVNHAVLTAEYAKYHGLNVLGFIINAWDDKKAGVLEKGNLYYYEKLTGLPILGKLPYLEEGFLENPEQNKLAEIVEKNVDIDKIIKLIGEVE